MRQPLPTLARWSAAAAFAAVLSAAPSAALASHTAGIPLGQECPAGSANHLCAGGTNPKVMCQQASDVGKLKCTDTTPAPVEAGTPAQGIVKPNLSIPIPTVKFTDALITDGSNGTKVVDMPFLAQYISGVYKYAVGVAALVAAVVMMIGGFRWMTAGGDASRVMAAKENISNAVVGLCLVLGSYALLYTISPDLVKLEGLKIKTVERIVFVPNETSKDEQPDAGPRVPATVGKNNVPYLNQGNYADVPYVNSIPEPSCETYTIQSSGCGITSAAMMIAFLNGVTGSAAADLPPELATLAHNTPGARHCNSACTSCNGTHFNGFKSGQEKTYGVKVSFPGTGKDKILALLSSGKPVIANVGSGIFTSGGHYIVLTGVNEDQTISVNDPGHRPTSPYVCDHSKGKCSKNDPNVSPGIDAAKVPQEYVFSALKSTVLITK